MFNRPVSELNMSRQEINQALAYLELNPPEQGANHRTASVLAQIANWSGKTMKEGKTVSPEDYMGKPKEPEKPQTADEQLAFMRSFRPPKEK